MFNVSVKDSVKLSELDFLWSEMNFLVSFNFPGLIVFKIIQVKKKVQIKLHAILLNFP